MTSVFYGTVMMTDKTCKLHYSMLSIS